MGTSIVTTFTCDVCGEKEEIRNPGTNPRGWKNVWLSYGTPQAYRDASLQFLACFKCVAGNGSWADQDKALRKLLSWLWRR